MTSFTELVDFLGGDGTDPDGGLIADAAGNLFGETREGGAYGGTFSYGLGTIYELPRTTNGWASTPITLFSFDGTDGAAPTGGIAADAAGDLFGTTATGLFELVDNGNGSYTQTNLINFGGNSTIYESAGGVLIDAAGNLIGATDGTIYEVARTGSGYASTLTVLANIGSLSPLVRDSAGDLFGTNNFSIFEIPKIGNGYSHTPVTIATLPTASKVVLSLDAAGDIFGTASDGGSNGDGSVFEIAKVGAGYASTVSTLVSFDGSNGEQDPEGGVIVDGAGNLFGTTVGGDETSGTVFEIPRSAGGYSGTPTILVDMDDAPGSGPDAPLLAVAGGNLLGSTYTGGAIGDGILFELSNTGFQTPSAIPPTISGSVAGQTVSDEATITPFSNVTIADSNAGQTDTVTVTLSAAANGTLSNLGGFILTSTPGVYSYANTAAAVTTALDGLVFDPTLFQAAPGQSVTTTFTINVTDTAGQSAIDSTTSVITNETQDPNYSAVVAVYQKILRLSPSPASADQEALRITAGQTTLSTYANSLISGEQALYTTIAALVTVDAFYNATPSSANLTTIATATSGTSYYTAAELHNLGYSDTNVWTVLASGWGADPTSNFYNLYDTDATGTTAGYTAFINAVYTREFGAAPTAANLQNLLADIPGTQALLNGGGHIATPIQVMAGLYGYLLEVGQTYGIGQYASLPATALLGETAQPAAIPSATEADAITTPSETTTGAAASIADPGVIIVTGSNQLIDPGMGNHAIQFLAGTAADTLVLHNSGVDQVSGFDPGTDFLDLRSLLTGTGLDLTGGIGALSRYLTIVDQRGNALLDFDPTEQGGGRTVVVLQGLGSTATGLNTLIAQGAIRIS
jgi:hypothetical protein